ncbi:hypothetical protein OnM2_098040 [Erysiphe neolycopersici]|uniref:Uncharacterized protein n=1 Tax=Erysiphe neolycopersici TaxID=212602 RepID=A0A420HAE0_9PEZI|nr:hypothetical protein OnM2_098040 [Erysiphe neolycopersici]
MPANPRDSLTGRLMAELPEEEQERIWIRRLEGIAAAANQAEFLKELRHPTDVEQQKEDEAMANTLDLTEFGGWFHESNSKIQTKNLRFDDCYGWYSFIGYLQSLVLWSDEQIQTREDMSLDLEDKYQSEVNKFRDKRDRYRNEIVSTQKEIDKL